MGLFSFSSSKSSKQELKWSTKDNYVKSPLESMSSSEKGEKGENKRFWSSKPGVGEKKQPEFRATRYCKEDPKKEEEPFDGCFVVRTGKRRGYDGNFYGGFYGSSGGWGGGDGGCGGGGGDGGCGGGS